jgi:hypothetical protein
MSTQFVNGLPIRVSVSQSKVYREVLLTFNQLIEDPNSGFAQASAFYLDGLPSDGDTFSIENDTDGAETFTWRTAPGSAPFNVLIGADADAAMAGLATAIEGNSAYWDSALASNLDTINDGSGASTSGSVVMIWKRIPSAADNDRIYGTISTQAFGQFVDFSLVDDYRRAISAELLVADPAVENFGVGRIETFLLPGERHATLKEDETWAWDGDRLQWTLVSGESDQFVVRSFVVGVTLHDVVYQSASGTVDRASASALSTSRPVGIVRTLNAPDPGLCEVQWGGDIDGFTGLTPGKHYILSKAVGEFLAEDDTANIDYPDAADEVIQRIGIANSATELFVNSLSDPEVIK